MKTAIQLILDQCENLSSKDIDRLVSELEDLSNMKYEAEEASGEVYHGNLLGCTLTPPLTIDELLRSINPSHRK